MLLLTVILVIAVYSVNAAVYDVTKFGADNSGRLPSTRAIASAINTAAAHGGGIIHFPPGRYITGPIQLKTAVTLNIPSATYVKFLDDPHLYPPIRVKCPDGKGRNMAFTPLISAFCQQNVAIKGDGVLDGSGLIWWNRLPPPATRPVFIHFFNCHNIVIDAVTIKNSPMFNVNIVDSHGILLSGIKIENPTSFRGKGPNTDGINCNGCKQLHITGATIRTGDDCIALDAGKSKRSTSNVLIENCQMLGGHGGVSIGSLTAGGLYNITVRNCVFKNTVRGLFIKTNRERGGLIKNIQYSNIQMQDVQKQGIAIAMIYNEKSDYHTHNIPRQPIKDTTPVIHDIHFDRVWGTCYLEPVLLVGVPESPVRDIRIANFDVKSQKNLGFYLFNTHDIEINNRRY